MTLNEPEMQVSILIVDDHPMVRQGLSDVLERHNFRIVGLAENGRQAIEMYFTHRPNVLLLDLRLPDMSGFDVVRSVLERDPAGYIVILSHSDGDASIHTAISLGVRGYLLKGIEGTVIAEQLRRVARGERSFSPETAEKLSQFINSERLSKREIQVLRLVSQGKRNKEIADLLSLSEETVKMHVKNSLRKLHAKDRTQAVVIAIQRGLIDF